MELVLRRCITLTRSIKSFKPAREWRVATNRIMKQVYRASEDWVEMMNTTVVLPMTPLDQGPLRESNYTVKQVRINGITIETGFNTEYAPVVHEWPKNKNWTTPGTSSGFMRPFYTMGYNLPAYIKTKVRI